MRTLAQIVVIVVCLAPGSVATAPRTCLVHWEGAEGQSGKAQEQAFETFLHGLNLEPIRSQALVPAHARTKRAPSTANSHPMSAWRVLQFESQAACEDAIQRLHRAGLTVEAVRLLSIPDSQKVPAGSQPFDVTWNVLSIRAPEAIQEVDPDSSLVVAVIDTGADLTHPDLQLRLWRNDDPPGNGSFDDDAHDQNGDGIIEAWEIDDDDDNGYVDDEHGFDFTDAPGQGVSGDAVLRDPDASDENGHGTHIAGIIAAQGSLVGVAPFVQLMPVRAAFNTPFGGGQLETDDAAAGIIYAVDNGARVLNLSWGDVEESRVIRDAIDYAVANDVVVVAAAGNGNSNAAFYPATDPRVMGVGSTDRSGRRSAFSNFGAGIDLAAPGEEFAFPGSGILSLEPLALEPSGMGFRRGTSMAAPHVSAAAAIVASRHDRPDATTIRSLLLANARRAAGVTWSAERGAGELDVLAAVRSADDLVVAITGPVHPYRLGRVDLDGIVLSGDLQRYRIDAVREQQHIELLPWQTGVRFQESLVSADFSGLEEGTWEYSLQVETHDGRRTERHGFLQVDHTAPAVDTLIVQGVWQAGRPNHLASMQVDDPVLVEVRNSSGDLLAASAGYAERTQLVFPIGGAGLTVRFENTAGEQTTQPVGSVTDLQAWPEAQVLARLDRSALPFVPEDLLQALAANEVVVWGRGLSGENLGTAQAWVFESGDFVLRQDTGLEGRPAALGDLDGDGRATDLLVQSQQSIHWLLPRQPGATALADSLVFTTRADRVLGCFPAGTGEPYDAVLSSNDSIFVYGYSPSGVFLRQVLTNPSQFGFNVFGADAAAGNLDSDSGRELVCGDGEGFVSVFEWSEAQGRYVVEQVIDTGGSYTYEFTEVEGTGFVVGHQRTTSVTGDGFPSTAYEFRHYVDGPFNSIVLHESFAFLSAKNDLDAACSRFTFQGEEYLSLSRAPHVYLARWSGDRYEAYAFVADVAARTVSWGNFTGSGELELLVGRASGLEVWSLARAAGRPRNLQATSLGPDSLQLTWLGVAGLEHRVWTRVPGGLSVLLGTTFDGEFVVGNLQPFQRREYYVSVQDAQMQELQSATIVAQSQPRPRVRRVWPTAQRAFAVEFSNPMGSRITHPGRYRVTNSSLQEIAVRQIEVDRQSRVAYVSLEAEAECGPVIVTVDSLRDAQNGLLLPAVSTHAFEWVCPAAPFLVRTVELQAGEIHVTFSQLPNDVALDTSSYLLQRQGESRALLQARRVGSAGIALVPEGGPLLGRGLPYDLQIVGDIRSADSGAPLAPETQRFVLHPTGAGGEAVFVYPNPAGRHDEFVTFAEVAPGSRIRVYNLEGELVREIHDSLDGGARWQLDTQAGGRVGSGVYLYTVEGPGGRKQGRIGVRR